MTVDFVDRIRDYTRDGRLRTLGEALARSIVFSIAHRSLLPQHEDDLCAAFRLAHAAATIPGSSGDISSYIQAADYFSKAYPESYGQLAVVVSFARMTAEQVAVRRSSADVNTDDWSLMLRNLKFDETDSQIYAGVVTSITSKENREKANSLRQKIRSGMLKDDSQRSRVDSEIKQLEDEIQAVQAFESNSWEKFALVMEANDPHWKAWADWAFSLRQTSAFDWRTSAARAGDPKDWPPAVNAETANRRMAARLEKVGLDEPFLEQPGAFSRVGREDGIQIPSQVRHAAQFGRQPDGHVELSEPPAGATFLDLLKGQVGKAAKLTAEIPLGDNSFAYLRNDVQDYEEALATQSIASIWQTGNTLRLELEVDLQRQFARDPDKPPLKSETLKRLKDLVQGHNALIGTNPQGRDFDAYSPSPGEKQDAVAALERIPRVVEGVEKAPEVFGAKAREVMPRLARVRGSSERPDDRSLEESAFFVVETFGNAHKRVLENVADELQALDEKRREELRRDIKRAYEKIKAESGEDRPSGHFWPAFYAYLGATTAASSVQYIAFNGSRILEWIGSNRSLSGLGIALRDLMRLLGVS